MRHRCLFVAAALVLLGCGGDGDQGGGFAERGSRVCDALPIDPARLADPGADDVEAARDAIAELRDLEPPTGEEDVIAGALMSWEDYLDEVEGDGPVDRWVLDSAYEAHNVLAEAGLDTCAAHLPRQGPPAG